MKISLRLKLLLYKFFSGNFGKKLLKAISFGVKVKNLGSNFNPKNAKKRKFFVVITVDTESGYVNSDERRVWQKENPNAFVGYYYGIANLLKILSKHNAKATFFLSTQCFSAKSLEYEKIRNAIINAANNGHEIGLHLHPDSDFAIQKKLFKKFNATSAFFYSYKEKHEIIKSAREIIKEHLGKNAEKKLISFRWGNWALDTEGAKALQKLDFKIDSSATPGIKGHLNDGMKYDWSKVKYHYPWKLSITDYRAINHNNSGIIEMPIATFSFFGLNLRADPLYSVLLKKAFMEYYLKADRAKKAFPFVVITHSSEATYKDGNIAQTLKDLEDFIIFAKKFEDVRFVSLREAYNQNFRQSLIGGNALTATTK
ncbi:polysaccharide deacetylase family protein [Candidatus Woesearchaeota archaeon]|nr:polysaccharide deacetylase family protein [Candidatus Woesearchaeota archaeon]